MHGKREVYMAKGACVAKGGHSEGGHAWQGQGVCGGGMHGGVCVGNGWACMVRGWGRHAWQERRPLERTVRIPLECILVMNTSTQGVKPLKHDFQILT